MNFLFVEKIHYLVIEKVPSNIVKGDFFLTDFKIKSPYFEEESYEIVKIFGGCGQICSFLLLKSPYFSQWVLEVHQHVIGFLNFSICVVARFWLNPLVANHHFW